MATLVFDIETTAQPVENFDEVQQEYLFREAQKIPDELARAARHAEIQRQFLGSDIIQLDDLYCRPTFKTVCFTADDNKLPYSPNYVLLKIIN